MSHYADAMFSRSTHALDSSRRSEVTNLEGGAKQVFRFAGTKNK